MSSDPNSIEFADIQGLIRFGYAKLTEACYYLLRIRDASMAAQWLRTVSVANAVVQDDAPRNATHVALTAAGLRSLGVPENVVSGFSPEFLAGMAQNESRSRRLGDIGANAPQHWKWGTDDKVPDLVVLLFARPGELDSLKRNLESADWSKAFEVIASLPTSNLGGFEPFGFMDGVSQPSIDWNRSRPSDLPDQLQYGNLISIGEFLLGYPNEYGKYTERPLLDLPTADLPRSNEDGRRFDLGRNGSYLVLRQLKQEVARFWQYLYERASEDSAEMVRLAEAMVGRKVSGDALLPTRENQIPGVDKDDVRNHFTYAADVDGTLCPFGAHIRRANPRNPDLSNADGLVRKLLRTLGFCVSGLRDDLVASSRFHRILRRGREYGPALDRGAILQHGDDGVERGLQFICLNANISRQFEFVQNAWLMNAKFDALGDESDPLLGNRQPLPDGRPTDHFSVPDKSGLAQRIDGLPQFVTVYGGAYFFLPGIRALRHLASYAR